MAHQPSHPQRVSRSDNQPVEYSLLQHNTTIPALPPRSTSSVHHASSTYHTTTQPELEQYLHTACGSPTPSSWIKAINKGHFATWQGITSLLVKKDSLNPLPPLKGNSISSKRTSAPCRPTHPTPGLTPVNRPAYPMHTPSLTSQAKSPPTISSCGNKYILLLYDYDSNAILAEPMKNWSDTGHDHACNRFHQYLRK
jgi:hypothetical protein